MSTTIPSAESGPQRGAPAIEDLVANAGAINPPEVVAARGVPVDMQATADLKADESRMGKLEKLIELEDGATIADVAVRGANISFAVHAADGSDHRGFVPLAALGTGSKAKDAAERGLQSSPRFDGQPTGGTADPNPTSYASGPGLGATPTPGNLEVAADGTPPADEPTPDPSPLGGQPPAAPEGYEGLNAEDAAKYVTERDDADARAALAYEQAQPTPRTTVTKAGDARFAQT